MVDAASLTFIDYSSETSTLRINIADVDAANFAGTETALLNLQTVIAGLIVGNDVQRGFTTSVKSAVGAPASALAQRENKWLVGFRATSPANSDFGRNYTVEIPTADLTLLDSGTDMLWKFPGTPPAQVAAFNTEFELTAKSPEGSDVQVQYIRFVGRNI